MKTAREKKMTSAQMEKMLELVIQQPDLATGRVIGPDAKAKLKEMWEEAANALNCLEGPQKTGEKWQKAWKDWKSKTRSKVGLLSTQDDPAVLRTQLSDLEIKLISLMDTFGWTSVNIDEIIEGNLSAPTERDRKMSASQMETLVELMRQRPELASGRGGGDSQRTSWDQLALTLNADSDGPSKTGYKWQKAWIDWKCKTRAKMIKLQEKAIESGKKQPLSKHLSALEYKLASVMGWHHTATAELSECEEKFAAQSSTAARSSSDEWSAAEGTDVNAEALPLPSHKTVFSKRKKHSAYVRKRRKAESVAPDEGPRAGDFLELERQKVAALRGVAAEVAGLRADLRRYFQFCVEGSPDSKDFTAVP